MSWLILAVACSLAIAMIFKHCERQGLDRAALLTMNYAVATLVSLVLLYWAGAEDGLSTDLGLWALGVSTGVLFIAGFYIFSYAIQTAGMGLAAGVMRLSVVVPFLASWIIWNEQPSIPQLAGLGIAAVAFFLITRPAQPAAAQPRQVRTMRTAAVLGLLFLAGGLVDTALKGFDEAFAAQNSPALFLLLVFGVAFVTGLALVAVRGIRSGEWPQAPTYRWGLVLGLVNYGSAEFLLRAIAELRGPFVFPANSIAIVVGAALLGVFVWGERLSRANWTGLALAAGALSLLSRSPSL